MGFFLNVFTGCERRNMQDGHWLQPSAKELNFGATLTRPHAVDKIKSEAPALKEIPKKGPGP